MATQIGGTVRGVFTDTIIFEGEINKPKCNKDIIGGIRSTGIKMLQNAYIQNQDLINILLNVKNLLNLLELKNLN